MPTLSLRQAMTPTGNWVVLGVHNSTATIGVGGGTDIAGTSPAILTNVGEWTRIKVYNPGTEAISIGYDLRSEDGVLLESFTKTIGSMVTATLKEWSVKIASGTMTVRCARPTLVVARRVAGATEYDLPVLPLPPG